MSLPLTNDEKIDYIYKDIKLKKRYSTIKSIIKLCVLIFIWITIFNLSKTLDKDEMIWKFTDHIVEITTPIVNEMVKKMNINSWNLEGVNVEELLKNNPDLIKQLQK